MRRALLTAALAVYAGFVLVVTLTPRMPGTSSIALLVNAALAEFHSRDLLVGVDYDTVEFIANIGMFVPLGLLTALLLPRRTWWVLLLAGPVFSGFIELYQSLLLPDRVGEWRDVLSNSLGFLVAAGVVVIVRRARSGDARRIGA